MNRIGMGLALVLFATQIHAQTSIVGGWHFGDFEYPGARRYVLTLFEDGVYYAVDNEFSNPARAPVMERGTYIYNEMAGTLFLTVNENHGRPWVVSGRTLQASLSGDVLTISALGTHMFYGASTTPIARLLVVGIWGRTRRLEITDL